MGRFGEIDELVGATLFLLSEEAASFIIVICIPIDGGFSSYSGVWFMDFKKDHDYLICVDSDGTIMDTMTIKHNSCFGPCFIKVFGIKTNIENILNNWKHTKLKNKNRGKTRLQV